MEVNELINAGTKLDGDKIGVTQKNMCKNTHLSRSLHKDTNSTSNIF